MKKKQQIYAEFRRLLDDPKSTERDTHRFLKKYPRIIIDLFNASWNYYICVPEFRFGTDYRADFLVLSADSVVWHAVFIELEAPHDEIYLKNETPSEALRIAQKQIAQWETYFSNHIGTVRREIAKVLKNKDVGAQNKLGRLAVDAHIEIAHPDTSIWDKYHIVIGRRSMRYNEKTGEPVPGSGYGESIVTYDRLLDKLKAIEENPYLTNTEGYLKWSDAHHRPF